MALNAKPIVGLEFDSVDTTWQFWVEYGKKCGFGVRNDYLNKRKVDGLITSGRFVCSKEGSRLKDKRSSLVKKPRADTRSGCPVRISFRLRDGKYVIHEFEETHNHLLQHTETTHMLASHRKISEVQAYEIEMAEESGLMQKSSFQLMSTQAGGRNGVIIDHIGNEVVDDPKLFSTHRYKRLCSTMIRLAADVSTSEYLHKLVEKGLYDLCKLVMEARLREIENADDEGDAPTVTKEYESQPKGFKIKPGLQNRRRLKSCVELMSKKKSKATIVKPTPRQRSKDLDSLSQMESGTSTLAQSACELSQTSEDNFSFTRLLMEPLNDG